jgi:pimeloyl-ACP methyl ester carboxylesterase
MTTSHVLFVHGSFLPSWTWVPVMERLSARGLDCRAIDLPFTSLADDVAYLQHEISVLREQGGVTVVGHSYTGITVSAASHDAQHLVFVAARMPALGESQAGINPEWGNPEFRSCLQIAADGELSLSDDAEHFLFHRSPASLSKLAMQHRRSMRSEIPVEPMDNPAWLTVPSSYIVCTDDQAVRIEQQRMRAAWAQHSVELDADHSPFFSAPQETADFIFETHRTEVG